MKKNLLLLVMGLLCLTARSIPADPKPIQVQQPDGTMLTIKLHGDEFFHYTTTSDGYTVVKNDKGYYTYARLAGNQLVSSGVIAHDAAQRTATDQLVIDNLSKRLISPALAQEGALKLNRRNSVMRRLEADERMDYGNFKGLIILINYTDKKFSMANPNDFYDKMVNTPGFTGYTLGAQTVEMTGSVRDYYYDNSNHIFDPCFDIVGPVNVNYSCRYPKSTANADAIFNAALKAVDPDIDFNDYDSDGDGYVDMVFFLVAGYSANYSGNSEDYLWPHMYYLYWSEPLDNVRFGLYACSTEIAGWEYYQNYHDINGIGTFCHEFSHVLGLPDLYDTDYAQGGGGQSRDPGQWSIMAGGSGNNYGRDPVGYSLYERYSLGFTSPTVIDSERTVTIQPLDESNHGYRLNTLNADEFFLIENRQDGKWDRYLPGHGMLVARVDSTNQNVWYSNQVNCKPSHMYYELLRANYVGFDSKNDPFPGLANVDSITNFTNPNLQTWDKILNQFIFTGIVELNRTIHFKVEKDTTFKSIIEDFEIMPVTGDLNMKEVQGIYSKWDFTKCSVGEAQDGSHAVAMKKPSQITSTSPLQIKPFMITYAVNNPTGLSANTRVTYSVDNGTTWLNLPDGITTIQPKETRRISHTLPTDEPIMLRITQTSGSAREDIYLESIELFYTEQWPEPTIIGDVNIDGEVNIADVNDVINMVLTDVTRDVGDVNGDGEINISDINMLIDIILSAQ